MEHNLVQVHEPGCALPQPSCVASGVVCELLAVLLLCAQVRQVRPSFCWRLWLAAQLLKVYARWEVCEARILADCCKAEEFLCNVELPKCLEPP